MPTRFASRLVPDLPVNKRTTPSAARKTLLEEADDSNQAYTASRVSFPVIIAEQVAQPATGLNTARHQSAYPSEHKPSLLKAAAAL